MVQENWERILGTVSEAKRRLQGEKVSGERLEVRKEPFVKKFHNIWSMNE